MSISSQNLGLTQSVAQFSFDDRLLQQSPRGLFTNCLAIVDGTECEVERPGDDELWGLLYSGKKKKTTLMYEVACRIQDGGLCWTEGPFVGSQNDLVMHDYYDMASRLLPFEFVMADLGYCGRNHVITAYKRDGGSVL